MSLLLGLVLDLPSGILGDGGIVVVGLAGSAVIDDVLEDSTESNSVVDIWFLLLAETDALGVASTFNVEDAGVGPDVFIVTDEGTAWISGECAVYTCKIR